MLSLLATMALLGAPEAGAAALGDPIDEAIALHLTPDGLDTLGEVVERLVPPAIDVTGFAGEFECSEDDEVPLAYDMGDLSVLISVDEVKLDTADGRLVLSLIGGLSSTATELEVVGDCSAFEDFDEVCGVELPLTAFEARVGLEIVEAEGAFDVVVDEVSFELSPIGNPLSDCTLADAFGTVIGLNADALSDLLEGLVAPSLEDLGTTVEEALEPVLNELDLETELDLLGATLTLSMYPSLVQLDERGMVLGLGAIIDVGEASSCVDTSGGSQLTESGWPDFAETAGGTSLEPDIGLYIGKDFGDHLLYSVWASGALCLDAGGFLGDGGLTAGTFHTTLGETFAATYPEDTPVALLVDPSLPPTMEFSHDGAPLRLALHDLGIELFAPLDSRQHRVLRTDINGEIGIDIALDEGWASADTGADTAGWQTQIRTGIDYDPDDLRYSETFGETVDRGYAEALSSLVGGMLGNLLPDDALPTVGLPDMFGLELQALIWVPTEDGAWHGGFLLLDASGVEPVDLGGCEVSGLGCDGDSGIDFELGDALGCDESGFGCDDTSCSSVSHQRYRAWRGRVALLVFAGLLMGLRRRA